MGFWWDIEILTQAGYDTVSITEYDFKNENSLGRFKTSLRYIPCVLFVFPSVMRSLSGDFRMLCTGVMMLRFYDRRWNEKPEYAVWKYMFNELYATHETVETDANGLAKIRGYRGKYDITVDETELRRLFRQLLQIPITPTEKI